MNIEGTGMSRNVSIALFVTTLIIMIVATDIFFFRNRIWERLMVNIGIVLVLAAIYLGFFKHPQVEHQMTTRVTNIT